MGSPPSIYAINTGVVITAATGVKLRNLHRGSTCIQICLDPRLPCEIFFFLHYSSGSWGLIKDANRLVKASSSVWEPQDGWWNQSRWIYSWRSPFQNLPHSPLQPHVYISFLSVAVLFLFTWLIITGIFEIPEHQRHHRRQMIQIHLADNKWSVAGKTEYFTW